MAGGAPGGAGPYVTGPARPKAATPGNRGPAVARAGPRIWVRHRRRSAGGASRRSIASFERDGKKGSGPARAPETKARDREVMDECERSDATMVAINPRRHSGARRKARTRNP